MNNTFTYIHFYMSSMCWFTFTWTKPKKVLHASSPVLNEGFDQLCSQAGKDVVMTAWISKALTFLWHLSAVLCIWKLEVQVRGEGPEKVQDVGSTVITKDAFGLDTRAKLHWAVVMVKDLVTLDS